MFDFNSGSQLIFGMLCHYSGRSGSGDFPEAWAWGIDNRICPGVLVCGGFMETVEGYVFRRRESLFPGGVIGIGKLQIFRINIGDKPLGVHHFYLSVPEAGLGVGHHTALFSPGDGHIQESPLLLDVGER